MQFISYNTALIEPQDLINNTLTVPAVYDVSFTINSKLVNPHTVFQNDKRVITFDNISNTDIIHCFFHIPLQGAKNKNMEYKAYSALFALKNPNPVTPLFQNNYHPRIQDNLQNTEMDNLSISDTSFKEIYTANHISYQNDTIYPAYIPLNTLPVLKVIVENIYEPLWMQYVFYDSRQNIIEKVLTIFDHLKNENSSSSLSSNQDGEISENENRLWTSTFEINHTFHQILINYGKIINGTNVTYHDLYWRCRYANYAEGNVVLWRGWSPMISFRINEPPTAPTNLNIK